MGFKLNTFDYGKMAEWSIAAVLKTVDLKGFGGSNPSLSAKKKDFSGVSLLTDLRNLFSLSTAPAAACGIQA